MTPPTEDDGAFRQTKLIIGCGYLGRRVAQRWLEQGNRVIGVARREQSAAELVELGIEPIVADITRSKSLEVLPEADTVLYCVGHDPSAGDSLVGTVVNSLQAVLDVIATKLRRFIYTSSTSVYGQTDGRWVDEDSPCTPIGDSAQAVLAAEKCIASHAIAQRSIVLRLAGLYGTDRILRRVAQLASGPPPSPSETYLNLIHVDDAAAAISTADEQVTPPALYNVSDGTPIQRQQYFASLLELHKSLQLSQSDVAKSTASPPRASSNKRVNNRRLLDELGFRPIYPTFHAFLQVLRSQLDQKSES
jgi:nucleoside-diphosphate-sugar epimerase